MLLAGLLASVVGATVAGGSAAEAAGSGDLRRATLLQRGRNLIFTVRTGAPVALTRLDRTPSVGTGEARYLCLSLEQAYGVGRLICLGGARSPRDRAGLELVDAKGGTTVKSAIPVRLKRPEPLKLVLALEPRVAGLRPHRYRWRVVENREGCNGCDAGLPTAGARIFRLRPVRAVGCAGGSAGLVTNGPRNRRAVALTFDDGPSEYTDDVLDVLRDEHAHGTFFELGQEMAGRADVMRRILREGSEIGDHTLHHALYPGYSDIAATGALIRSATHFQPCLFRPPDGAVNSAVVDAAGGAGMKTVNWDVDPVDWSAPGRAAVYSRVVGAVRPGSIVIMHDGGGNRSGTVAALPAIIHTLRARGYSFPTVTRLLGHRIVYQPYG